MVGTSESWVIAAASLTALGCGKGSQGVDSGEGGQARNGTGGDSASGAMIDAAGGTDNTGVSLDQDAGGTNDECVCVLVECSASLDAFCSQLAEGCPDQLDTWLTCSEAGLISSPGRFGYHLRNDGELTVVYYVYGFGDDVYWAYDSSGTLVGAGTHHDYGGGTKCGVSSFGWIVGRIDSSLSDRAIDAGSSATAELEALCAPLLTNNG